MSRSEGGNSVEEEEVEEEEEEEEGSNSVDTTRPPLPTNCLDSLAH